MKMKLQLLAALALMGTMPFALTACGGSECGEGTTEQDGKCIAENTGDSVTCAEGTTLTDGKCEADEVAMTTCGEGTELDGGECVATGGDDPSEACGEGTTYDEGTESCVPNSTIECGEGTTEQDGKCVADAQPSNCAAGTTEADDGSCVVDPAVCGENTVLEPNSNTCLVSDAGVFCGGNTAYDMDSDSCLPTDQVCDTGTTFSTDTGLCLPDATCKQGDVILDGICVAPIEEAIANADQTSPEVMDPAANNDDPLLGGTPATFSLAAMGSAYTIAGHIQTPVDLDGDMIEDQDLDFYTFSATAGQTLNVSVQPTAGPSLSFAVVAGNGSPTNLTESENFLRYSVFGLNSGSARSVVIPEDGDYTIIVAPSFYFANGFEGGPSGADGWTYALRVEEIMPFVATDVDPTAGPITGDFQNLSDNLFKLTNFQGGPGTLTVNSLGSDIGGPLLQISTANGVFKTFEIASDDDEQIILPSGDIFFFFDWTAAFGRDTGFDISFTPTVVDEDLGTLVPNTPTQSTATTLASGDSKTYTIKAPAGHYVEVSHANDETNSVEVTVTSSSGQVFADTTFSNVETGYVFALQDETFLVEVTGTADHTNEILTFNALPFIDLGQQPAGSSVSHVDANAVDSKRRDFITVTFTEDVLLSGALTTGPNNPDADLRIKRPDGSTLRTLTSGGGEEFELLPLTAGTYVFDVLAFVALPDGYELSLTAFAPPTPEVEPNNTIADAQALATGELAEGTSSRDGMDPDIFSLTITTPGVYNVAVDTTGASGCAVLSLHTDAGDVIEQDSGTSSVNVAAYLQAQTYLFSVDGNCAADTATFDYSVSIQNPTPPFDAADTEPNNDSASATMATAVMLPGTVVGTIVSATDEDWFRFSSPAGGNYSVRVEDFGTVTPNANMVFEFFDINGASLGVDAATVAAGDFFVKVSGFDGADFQGNSYVFTLSPPPADFISSPNVPIPNDNTPFTNTLNVPASCVISGVELYVDIPHEYRGDLDMELTSPAGTTVTLVESSFDGTVDYLGYFPTDFTPVDDFSIFNTESAMGDWVLTITDTYTFGDVGSLNEWGLNFTCAP